MTSAPEPKLSDVLEAGVLRPACRCVDLPDALQLLLAPALASAGLSKDEVDRALEAVLVRERAGSTKIGPVSLPHTRVPGLPRIVAGLGTNTDGAFPGEPETTFVLAFASPASAAASHLRFLARAAQLFRDEEARSRLLGAADREALLEAVRSAER